MALFGNVIGLSMVAGLLGLVFGALVLTLSSVIVNAGAAIGFVRAVALSLIVVSPIVWPNLARHAALPYSLISLADGSWGVLRYPVIPAVVGAIFMAIGERCAMRKRGT
jgi:hypothetical protein